ADSVQVRSPREVDLFFSEPPDPERTNLTQFEVSASVQPAALQLDSTWVVLEFDEDLPQGPLSIELNGVRSINNWQIPDGFRLETFVFGEASRRDVVLNELLYRRSSPDSYQFVELLNLTDDLIGLEGWELETERGSLTFPPGTNLQPGDYLLIADSQVTQISDERLQILPDFTPLRTTGDAVVLKNRESTVIDSLRYTPEWGGGSPGSSLERKDPQAISVDPANWAGSSTPTPLQPNRNFNTDTHPPQLLFAGYQPATGTILLRFDEFIDLSSTPLFSLNGLAASPNASPDKGNEILLNDPGNHLRESLMVRAENISDHQGNRAGSIELPVAHPVEPGDLVFNEIMFDPLEDDFDELPNQSEYIEIANRRDLAISLEGLTFHGEPNEHGEFSPIEFITTSSRWIPPHGYALLYPEPQETTFEDSRTARYFELSADNEPHSLQAKRSTLSLTTSGRTLFISDSLFQIIDSLHYNPDWHNPNLIDTKGIALERIRPKGDTNNAQNWGSSTAIKGGTPGEVNSLFQHPEISPEMNQIHIEPNPFSPDGDGHDDRLFINYAFDDPHYMVRTRIYDRYGRKVRTLSDSTPSGFEGTITWDGRMENGNTCRVGIYIIHIEAYNSSTGSKKEFKETAVLARKF
ncbi:MAG: lamin tail domain-containing protein, partial [Bacteroidota bacterium]